MSVRFAINGFGRIGRCLFRAAYGRGDLDVVAINDIDPPATLAHLLKYDSVHGTFPHEVSATERSLKVDGREYAFTAVRDPAQLAHKAMGVDVVLECSGKFNDREGGMKHVDAGARRVLFSAPARGVDLTVCYGVNHAKYDPSRHNVLSNASCTTNCMVPLAKVISDSFGLSHGLMTTIHSYTNDQRILDLPHKDLRRARAAALSMIPTTTGAARSVAEVLPELKGRLDGLSIRVPTPNVSLVDFTAVTSRPTTVREVNDAFRAAAEGPLRGILQYETAPTVSVDYNGNPHSAILDSTSTFVQGGTLVKVFAWYDNEWGFSNRMVDVARYIASKG